MNPRPDFRRKGSSGSDTSSFYSVRSGSVDSADSGYSVWSSSESDSFVWREDPWGFGGVGGAVTRYVDERDDKRRRFAAHFLSGPFAQFYKNKRSSSSNQRSGRSATSSRSSSRSSGGSVSPGRGHNQHFQQRPVSVEPQFHQGPFQQQQQQQQQQFHHQGFHGPPPPPPPPPAAAGPAGFEGGFIQLGGPSGPPPPPGAGDPWDNTGYGYGDGGQIYD
ncbi:hypothetical protein F4677DRAFT_256813 [Hypoxylon crocopeplum]|nr:hypothetical protein F4677DRAFT_256813 [Hypoxylon crocopeplum]